MIKIKLFILILLLAGSCNFSNTDKSYSSQDSVSIKGTANLIEQIETQPITDTTDTLIIDKKCVVFYYLDSLGIEKLIKQFGEETFHVAYDDYSYYLVRIHDYFRNKNIESVDCDSEYIKFIKEDGKEYSITCPIPINCTWGMLFFNRKEDPWEMKWHSGTEDIDSAIVRITH